MVDNITNQVDSCTLMLFCAVDLKSKENPNGHCQKISALYNMFEIDAKHTVWDKWNGVSKSITLRRKLNCSSEELQKEFKKAFPVINGMARTLRLSHKSLVLKS